MLYLNISFPVTKLIILDIPAHTSYGINAGRHPLCHFCEGRNPFTIKIIPVLPEGNNNIMNQITLLHRHEKCF